MYPQYFVKTPRLRTAYYRAEEREKPKLLLIHGNLSSSVFFLPLLPYLSRWFDVVIPDMRCFGDTEDLPIDARRGYRDWSDDMAELVDALGWEKFSIAGWSMGGDVVMQYAIDHGQRLEKMVLIAPGPPFGFGGCTGDEGTPLRPLGLGSGGGCANPQLVMAISAGSRLMLRDILNHLYFVPPFRMTREWEDRFLGGIAKIKVGPGKYPGDYRVVPQWPFFAAGDRGVLNTMTPNYGNLSALADIPQKPPILWLRGNRDRIVSDHSVLELNALGSDGVVPGWPGERLAPPQPMLRQTRYLLDQYQANGGRYQELVIPGGHMCCLESPQYFLSALCSFLLE